MGFKKKAGHTSRTVANPLLLHREVRALEEIRVILCVALPNLDFTGPLTCSFFCFQGWGLLFVLSSVVSLSSHNLCVEAQGVSKIARPF